MNVEDAADTVKEAIKIQERTPATVDILLKNHEPEFLIVANNVFTDES